MPKIDATESDPAIDLASLLDHRKPRDVITAVQALFRSSFPKRDFAPVTAAFPLVAQLFEGTFTRYRACNTEYHDYVHSLEVFSTCARLIDGAMLSGALLSAIDAADLLVAALVHDSGYIQEEGDLVGTGAKYTGTHVARSAAFIERQAADFGLAPDRAARIARLVLGTELSTPWDALPFADDVERLAGSILAAADLLGQMSDRAYLEKLLFLYYEFREAGFDGYATAFDILRKTAGFYASVQARLDGPLGAASVFSQAHFGARHGVDRDLFRAAIERQMSYLDSILADDKLNFRRKLKRLDLEAVERRRAG